MDMRKNITRFWSEVDDEKNRRILDAYFHNFIFYITCNYFDIISHNQGAKLIIVFSLRNFLP